MPTNDNSQLGSPGVIEVYEPISKRFLFRFYPETMTVEVKYRNTRTDVNLAKLKANARDLSAVVTTTVPCNI